MPVSRETVLCEHRVNTSRAVSRGWCGNNQPELLPEEAGVLESLQTRRSPHKLVTQESPPSQVVRASPEKKKRANGRHATTPERDADGGRDRWDSPEDLAQQAGPEWTSARARSPEPPIVWVDTALDWNGKTLASPGAGANPSGPEEAAHSPVTMHCALESIRQAWRETEPIEAERCRASQESAEPLLRKSAARVLDRLWELTGPLWAQHDSAVSRAFGRLRRIHARWYRNRG